MKILLVILTALLLSAGIAYADEWDRPQVLFLTDPPIRVGLMAQAISTDLDVGNQRVVNKECLPLPPWTTINPDDQTKQLWQGELVSVWINYPKKPDDGTIPTCQYEMRLKSDHSVKWNCLGLTNSERLRRQNTAK